MSEPSAAHRTPVRRVPGPLAGAAVGAVALAAMLLLALAVSRWPFPLDREVLLAMRRWSGPVWLRETAVDLTALGGGTVLTLAVMLAAGLLAVQRLWLTAAAVIASSWTGNQVVDLLKAGVARARPDMVAHLVPVHSQSFPSGHAANSAIVYLTLAALASQVTRRPAARRFLFASAILLVGAIGCSRVYLGVHWPSDVLAGWSFGTLWALGWWWATAEARASIGGERK